MGGDAHKTTPGAQKLGARAAASVYLVYLIISAGPIIILLSTTA